MTTPEATTTLVCDFCAHRCVIPSGKTGRCRVRYHAPEGTLRTIVYGQIQAAATDPIEKKPLYHFLPGTQAFSVALGGCNFRCRFCQNDSVAFAERLGPPRAHWEPVDLLRAWRESRAPTIAFTYTEPSVWQDYLIDCAVAARREGARIVMVSNGFLSPEAVERLVPVVDAFNFDLKGDDRFYRTLCRGRYAPVIESIRAVAGRRHLEVTSMLMDGHHRPEVLDRLYETLVEAGVKVWHLSRFFPAGEMRREPATSEEFLTRALRRYTGSVPDGGASHRDRDDGSRGTSQEIPGIPFIYAGNSRKMEYQQTLCPRCGTLCVSRDPIPHDYTDRGACPGCGHELFGVFV